jgi:hypothetical protein
VFQVATPCITVNEKGLAISSKSTYNASEPKRKNLKNNKMMRQKYASVYFKHKTYKAMESKIDLRVY